MGASCVLGLAASVCLGALALAQTQDTQLEALNQKEVAVSALQGRNRSQLARLLTVLVRFRRDPPPPLLVRPNDAVDAARAAILVKAIIPELQRRARVYAAEAQEITRQRRLAADEDDRGPVATVAAITGERGQLDVTAPKRLLPPLDGKILYGFGEDMLGGGKSTGLVLTAQPKATVYAPAKGLVQFVGPVKGWGVVVILRLTGGYHLVLAGLEATDMAQGEDIFQGSKVGSMPDGRNGPAQLYLEVRAGDTPIDPGPLLKSPGH